MKKLAILFICGFIFLSSTAQAASYDFANDSGIKPVANKAGFGKSMSPEFYVGLILTIFFSIIGIIFLVLIVLSGVKWMTAQGNTSRVDQAKDTITKAITGLIITLAAYGITYFVIKAISPTSPFKDNIDNNTQETRYENIT